MGDIPVCPPDKEVVLRRLAGAWSLVSLGEWKPSHRSPPCPGFNIMPEKSWKRTERKVAELVSGKRNPLSGRMGGHTCGDVIHDVLYVEVKQRRKFEVVTLMRDTEEKARKEKKIPVVALHQKGTQKRYYVMEEWLFLSLIQHLFRPPSTATPSAGPAEPPSMLQSQPPL